ncbi:type II toxin-antitoxin system RelE/ParE family toxin [Pseudoduganella namucuonensis]|uniref:type II toxin-antitoxin system RelE/ParE family toxin n=1 Tax=Pseudoduganella namucuonensis TaxID=1035707 RepID=UPI000B8591A0|nr:type II toxin-antitoxin system RelE/ParE family toxin [Pseudoduganella namucuonensis]
MGEEKEIRWVGTAYSDLLALPYGPRNRIIYIAKFEEAVYVLHCFQKKSLATAKEDKDIAVCRYRAVVHARRVAKSRRSTLRLRM